MRGAMIDEAPMLWDAVMVLIWIAATCIGCIWLDRRRERRRLRLPEDRR